MNIVDKLVYALNKIPNQKGVGPNGESTYDLLSEYDSMLRNPVDIELDPQDDKLFDSAGSISFTVLHEDQEPTHRELLDAIFRRYLIVKQSPEELDEAVDLWDTFPIVR
jgi:hypothetical protein